MPAAQQSADYRPTRRIEGRPRVFVTRRLLPETEARMAELFDVTLNPDDRPLAQDEIRAAMQTAHVLVPTVTDRIDAGLIAAAGPQLGLIASFGAGTDHIDLAAARAHRRSARARARQDCAVRWTNRTKPTARVARQRHDARWHSGLL